MILEKPGCCFVLFFVRSLNNGESIAFIAHQWLIFIYNDKYVHSKTFLHERKKKKKPLIVNSKYIGDLKNVFCMLWNFRDLLHY